MNPSHFRERRSPVMPASLVRRTLARLLLAAPAALLAACSGDGDSRDADGQRPRATESVASNGWLIHARPNPDPTAAYKWLDILLETSARRVDRIGAKP